MSFGPLVQLGATPDASRFGHEPVQQYQVGPGQVAPSNTQQYVDPTPPTTPVAPVAIPIFKGMSLSWNASTEPRVARFELQYATKPDGGAYGEWASCPGALTSTVYTHAGLDPALEYKYRLRCVSHAEVTSQWSTECLAGKPLKASLSEDVVDKLAGEFIETGSITADHLDESLSTTVGKAEADHAYFANMTLTPEEFSTSVLSVGPEGSLTTTVAQHTNDISQRIVKGTGEVITEINASPEGVRIAGNRVILDGDTQVDGTFTVNGDMVVNGTLTLKKMNMPFATVSSLVLVPSGGTQTIEHAATTSSDWNVISTTPFDDTERDLVIYHDNTVMTGLIGAYEVQLSADGVTWSPGMTTLNYVPDYFIFLPDNITMLNFGHTLIQSNLIIFRYKSRTFGGATTLWIRFRRLCIQAA